MGKKAPFFLYLSLIYIGLILLLTKVHSIKRAATKSLPNLHYIHLSTQIHCNQYKTVMAHISHYIDLPL